MPPYSHFHHQGKKRNFLSRTSPKGSWAGFNGCWR